MKNRQFPVKPVVVWSGSWCHYCIETCRWQVGLNFCKMPTWQSNICTVTCRVLILEKLVWSIVAVGMPFFNLPQKRNVHGAIVHSLSFLGLSVHDLGLHGVGVCSVAMRSMTLSSMVVHSVDMPEAVVHKTWLFFSIKNIDIWWSSQKIMPIFPFYLSLKHATQIKGGAWLKNLYHP